VENSIFEVSLAQAISALRRAVGSDDLADVSLTRAEPLTGEQNGYCSRGLIATFAGQAQGRPWERTLFVKRHHWDHYQEEMHYERLARLGFPIVHLYGRVTSSGGTEVLFLEYLNRAGIDVAAAEQISELFRLHARLNALASTSSAGRAARATWVRSWLTRAIRIPVTRCSPMWKRRPLPSPVYPRR
jgi:hypothetical protein